MFSISTRLHILLAITVVCVAFYIYSIGKEIQVFHKDLVDLRKRVNAIQQQQITSSTSGGTNGFTDPVNEVVYEPEVEKIVVTADTPVVQCIEEADEDDHVSISSNEIKNIISSISKFDDDILNIVDNTESEIQDIQVDISIPENKFQQQEKEKEREQDGDLTKLSDEELAKLDYATLKTFVKKVDGVANGKKANFIERVKELRKNIQS